MVAEDGGAGGVEGREGHPEGARDGVQRTGPRHWRGLSGGGVFLGAPRHRSHVIHGGCGVGAQERVLQGQDAQAQGRQRGAEVKRGPRGGGGVQPGGCSLRGGVGDGRPDAGPCVYRLVLVLVMVGDVVVQPLCCEGQ